MRAHEPVHPPWFGIFQAERVFGAGSGAAKEMIRGSAPGRNGHEQAIDGRGEMKSVPNKDRLVTVFGGSGFVGRHVVRALARQGYRVRIAVRRPERSEERIHPVVPSESRTLRHASYSSITSTGKPALR